MTIFPILATWTGTAFEPASPVWAKRATDQYVIGERYVLDIREDRSKLSHDHFFVCLGDAWRNLPEALAEKFPTPEHLRKYALVKAGYRDERTIACSSRAEALRLAAFIKPMDDFAVIVTSEATVTVYTAKSQSMRAMGKRDFQASKDAVLEIIADMIGTTVEAISASAGQTA